ncbi:MAG: hypothetical protein J0665_06380 [Deltaproteobacteria bacterium]|nr:hypothetical protein [Deltaproteobacteria bacterium]
MENSEKLYQIAKHLNELNSKGKVKGFSGNENGYAKIFQVIRGCSIWIHLEKNNDLIIDLMISPTALEQHLTKCDLSIKKFTEYFQFKVKNSEWKHSIDKQYEHDRYLVSVSDLLVEEILKHIEKLKKKFS